MGNPINPWNRWYGSFVPNWLLSRQEIGATEKLLYASLCRHAGKNGKGPWPSVDTLADEMGVSRRTIFRALSVLEKVGLIRVRDRRPRPAAYVFLYHRWMRGKHFWKSGSEPPEDEQQAQVELEAQDPGEQQAQDAKPQEHKAKQARCATSVTPTVSCDVRCTTSAEVEAGTEAQLALTLPTKQAPAARGVQHLSQPGSVEATSAVGVQDSAPGCAKSGTYTVKRDPSDKREGQTSLTAPAAEDREGTDRALARRLQHLEPDVASGVAQVLRVYSEHYAKDQGVRYAWSNADVDVAAEAWLRASDLAASHAAEYGGDASEHRDRVIEHWCSKLVAQGGWVEDKGYQFWTWRHVVSALGTPLRVKRSTVARGLVRCAAPPPPAETAGPEYWSNTAKLLRAMGDRWA